MRPVNLLPEKERPYVPSGRRQGSSYAVVGLLAVLLLAVGAYVLMANSVTSTRTEAEQVRQEADRAEAKSGSLAAFGAFAEVKATRYASVTDLAGGRFDWERLMRELARVLPASTSVTELSTGTNGEGGADSASSGASGGSASGTGAASSGADGPETPPQLTLSGCAASQRDVATTLVRLRSLHRAVDVQLADSSKEDTGASGPTAEGTPAPGADGDRECGGGGLPGYTFQATVVFSPDTSGGDIPDAKVPGRLGGGS